jgi:hypothetical protein
MKKYFMLLMMLFVGAIALIAQEPADTTNVNIITGGTLAGFFKDNLWVLILIAYSILEAWFGQTQWIKEGSTLAFIWNWIGSLIHKQIPTVKAKFMNENQIKMAKGLKVLVIGVMLAGFSASTYAQGPFTGFFKPASANPDVYQMVQVSKAMKSGNLTADFDQPIINSKWLIRPTVGAVAKAFTYNKETKELESSTFNKVGFGVGYQKYEEINGQAYNSFGANILLLFDSDFDMSKLNFTAAATIHALKLVDVGIARDFGMKQWLLLTGITYSF